MNNKIHIAFAIILMTMLMAGCGSRAVRERERAIHEYTGPEVMVSVPVQYSDGAKVSDMVKNECFIEKDLPAHIKRYADEEGFPLSLVTKDQQDKGRVLVLEITQVRAPAGGVWTGPKSLTVKGKLFDDGKLTGSFKDWRWAAGNTTVGIYGNCIILDKAVKIISKDIVGYLAKPTMDAKIGEAE